MLESEESPDPLDQAVSQDLKALPELTVWPLPAQRDLLDLLEVKEEREFVD